MPNERLRRAVRAAMPLVVLGALAIHFAMTLGYLIPYSPLKAATHDTVRRYIEPYFTQSWELFAPDPTSNPRILMVSCRLEGGTETPWVDVTTRLREEHYAHRIGFADRVVRAQQSGFLLIVPPKNDMLRALDKEAEQDPEGEVARLLAEVRQKEADLGRRIFARTASVECDRLNGPRRTTDVNVRIVTIKPLPFSKRNDPAARTEKSAMDFGWRPYERVAAYF